MALLQIGADRGGCVEAPCREALLQWGGKAIEAVRVLLHAKGGAAPMLPRSRHPGSAPHYRLEAAQQVMQHVCAV